MVKKLGCTITIGSLILLLLFFSLRMHNLDNGKLGDFPLLAASQSILDQIPSDNRRNAVAYALTYHGGNRNDAEYPFFGITGNKNCTNFVSQVLVAGGFPLNVEVDWWMSENQSGQRLSGCGSDRETPWWAWLGGITGYLSAKHLPDLILGPRGDCGLTWSAAPQLYDYLTTTKELSQETTSLWVDLDTETITLIAGEMSTIRPGDVAFFLRDCNASDWQTCSPYHAAVVIDVNFSEGAELWFVDDAGHPTTLRSVYDIAAEFSRTIAIAHIRYPGEE